MEKLTFTMENYGRDRRAGIRYRRAAGRDQSQHQQRYSHALGKGLIKNEKYGEIFLTPAGQKLARLTSNKHRTLQKFFMEILRLDPDTADMDACAVEHVISNDAIQAMALFLEAYAKAGKQS